MDFLDSELRGELSALDESAMRRHLRIIESAQDARVELGGRSMLMLSSNNYLGLANHPEVKNAASEAIGRFGVGAGASRLVAGSIAPIHRLEQRIARLERVEAALIFGSGYLANLGAITALVGRGDTIFSDELNHASLIDGCRLSRAELRIYQHGDLDHLKVLLERCSIGGRRLIVTDSVFSMDGDLAPLAGIAEFGRTYGAAVMIDEAHALGVAGPGGAGLAAQLGLEREIDVHMGTLSKALGAYGGYIAGSRTVIDFLINRSRSFIYTTGLAPAIAAAAGAALDIMVAEPERIERLRANAAWLRGRLREAGFNVPTGVTAIIPVIIGDSRKALAMAERLFTRGIYVVAIRPPTVPQGTARLRVTPIASHTRDDLDEALGAFSAVGRELGII
ncbi:MAG: 8-amino-7-oxononanoate synthase [Candidatus Binataceae bacterium]